MNEVNNELLTSVVEYAQHLGEVVKLNSQSIKELGLFLQAVAKIAFKAVETGKNSFDHMNGIMNIVNDRFEIIELIQTTHFEFIEVVKELTYYSLGIGLLNTGLIFIIGIYLILRKK